MSKRAPVIAPVKSKEFTVKQSKYEHVPKLPTRCMILGPSGSGKTILLQNLILDIYKDCFNRIYIFSPSIMLDTSWKPVKEYITKSKLESKDEKLYFDSYNHSDLEAIVERQRKLTEFMKRRSMILCFKYS